jgi:hypothetical protein
VALVNEYPPRPKVKSIRDRVRKRLQRKRRWKRPFEVSGRMPASIAISVSQNSSRVQSLLLLLSIICGGRRYERHLNGAPSMDIKKGPQRLLRALFCNCRRSESNRYGELTPLDFESSAGDLSSFNVRTMGKPI